MQNLIKSIRRGLGSVCKLNSVISQRDIGTFLNKLCTSFFTIPLLKQSNCLVFINLTIESVSFDVIEKVSTNQIWYQLDFCDVINDYKCIFIPSSTQIITRFLLSSILRLLFNLLYFYQRHPLKKIYKYEAASGGSCGWVQTNQQSIAVTAKSVKSAR